MADDSFCTYVPVFPVRYGPADAQSAAWSGAGGRARAPRSSPPVQWPGHIKGALQSAGVSTDALEGSGYVLRLLRPGAVYAYAEQRRCLYEFIALPGGVRFKFQSIMLQQGGLEVTGGCPGLGGSHPYILLPPKSRGHIMFVERPLGEARKRKLLENAALRAECMQPFDLGAPDKELFFTAAQLGTAVEEFRPEPARLSTMAQCMTDLFGVIPKGEEEKYAENPSLVYDASTLKAVPMQDNAGPEGGGEGEKSAFVPVPRPPLNWQLFDGTPFAFYWQKNALPAENLVADMTAYAVKTKGYTPQALVLHDPLGVTREAAILHAHACVERAAFMEWLAYPVTIGGAAETIVTALREQKAVEMGPTDGSWGTLEPHDPAEKINMPALEACKKFVQQSEEKFRKFTGSVVREWTYWYLHDLTRKAMWHCLTPLDLEEHSAGRTAFAHLIAGMGASEPGREALEAHKWHFLEAALKAPTLSVNHWCAGLEKMTPHLLSCMAGFLLMTVVSPPTADWQKIILALLAQAGFKDACVAELTAEEMRLRAENAMQVHCYLFPPEQRPSGEENAILKNGVPLLDERFFAYWQDRKHWYDIVKGKQGDVPRQEKSKYYQQVILTSVTSAVLFIDLKKDPPLRSLRFVASALTIYDIWLATSKSRENRCFNAVIWTTSLVVITSGAFEVAGSRLRRKGLERIAGVVNKTLGGILLIITGGVLSLKSSWDKLWEGEFALSALQLGKAGSSGIVVWGMWQEAALQFAKGSARGAISAGTRVAATRALSLIARFGSRVIAGMFGGPAGWGLTLYTLFEFGVYVFTPTPAERWLSVCFWGRDSNGRALHDVQASLSAFRSGRQRHDKLQVLEQAALETVYEYCKLERRTVLGYINRDQLAITVPAFDISSGQIWVAATCGDVPGNSPVAVEVTDRSFDLETSTCTVHIRFPYLERTGKTVRLGLLARPAKGRMYPISWSEKYQKGVSGRYYRVGDDYEPCESPFDGE